MYFTEDFVQDPFNGHILNCMYRPKSYYRELSFATIYSVFPVSPSHWAYIQSWWDLSGWGCYGTKQFKDPFHQQYCTQIAITWEQLWDKIRGLCYEDLGDNLLITLNLLHRKFVHFVQDFVGDILLTKPYLSLGKFVYFVEDFVKLIL